MVQVLSSPTVWQPANRQAIILIQPNGPGNPVFIVDPRTTMDALSGGEFSFESLFAGLSKYGYVRTIVTSNLGRITSTIMSPFVTGVIPALREMANSPTCPHAIYILTGCDVKTKITLSGYEHAIVLIDVGFTNDPIVTNNRLVQTDNPDGQDMMNSIGFSAAVAQELLPLAVEDISGTKFTAAINQLLPLQVENCDGVCGAAVKIDDQWLVATDAPGGAYDDGEIWYSADGGATWTRNLLTGIGAGSVTSLDVAGDYVVFGVSGTDAGAYYAPLADIKAGTAVGAEATGLGTNQVNAIKAWGNIVIAVGQSGAAWISEDGGFSYEALLVASVLTTEHLTHIAGSNSDLVWIGGENGVLIRYKNRQAPGLVVVSQMAATDDITALAVPPLRPYELYIGTSVGEVLRTKNAFAPTPTFTELSFDKPAGGSSIQDMSFGGVKGNTLVMIQTNGSSQSRIILDRSGGNLGNQGVVLGTFTQPSNTGLNTVALSSQNYGLAGGEIDSTYAALIKIG